jgi:hypothetical protein
MPNEPVVKIHASPQQLLSPSGKKSPLITQLMISANVLSSLIRIHQSVGSREYATEHAEHLARADSFIVFLLTMACLKESLDVFKGARGHFKTAASRNNGMADYEILEKAVPEQVRTDSDSSETVYDILRHFRNKAAFHWHDRTLITSVLSQLEPDETPIMQTSAEAIRMHTRYSLADEIHLQLAMPGWTPDRISQEMDRVIDVQAAFIRLAEEVVGDHLEAHGFRPEGLPTDP